MIKKFYILFFICSSGNFFAQSLTSMTLSVNKYEPECQLGAAKINVQGGLPPYNFQWSSGAVGDSVSSLNGGNYTVHVSDADNTNVDADISFEIAAFNCGVVVSNHFSPNGDGINDKWTIDRIEQYPKFLVELFDRWGQLVHAQRGQFIPWDGTHLGLKVGEATYYYVFFYDEGDKKKIEKGSVTILR